MLVNIDSKHVHTYVLIFVCSTQPGHLLVNPGCFIVNPGHFLLNPGHLLANPGYHSS